MKKIIAVCACPAGIAHTYMAAESIENFAKKKGYEVKVETRGAGGVENGLSEEDIASSDVVIVAADTVVDIERFKGKKVLETSVSSAINKLDEIFRKIENDDLEIF